MKTVLFCLFLATRRLIASEGSEMPADNLASAPDFFVIQSDTRDGKNLPGYLCLVSLGWKIGYSLEVKRTACSLQLTTTRNTNVTLREKDRKRMNEYEQE